MMRGNDNSASDAAFQFNDIRVALALLTRLPLPYPPLDPKRSAAMAAWAYPLVGVVMALLMILSALVAIALELPAQIVALLAMFAALLATGAMHEDGLADCADGFWGGWTRERRLEIMKDSQIGTYGVLALLVSFGLRWQLIVVLIGADMLSALLPAAVASRSAMVWMMYHLPNVRTAGLSQQTGTPTGRATMVALGLGFAAMVLFFATQAFFPLVVVAACTFGVSMLARAKIGGQTGDVLGATQQIAELAILLAVVALM